MPSDFVGGRPAPKKLEIEVVTRFKRWDAKYAEEQKKRYPRLYKDPPAVGAPGTGSVIWVGLNPDPCRAKFLAKNGHSSSTGSLRPASAPVQGRAASPGSLRPASAPALGRPPLPVAPMSLEETALPEAEEDGHGGNIVSQANAAPHAFAPFVPDSSNASGPQRHQRPSSAPARSRQRQAARVLAKEGGSALEKAFLVRELVTGKADPTQHGPPAPLGANSGKPKKGAWLSKSVDHYGDSASLWNLMDQRPPTPQAQTRLKEDQPPECLPEPTRKLRPVSAGSRPSSADSRKGRQPLRELSHINCARPSSADARKGRPPLKELSRMTCNQHFIEQKLGLSRIGPTVNPFPEDPLELLYYGTSKEDQGRTAYLKERHKLAPQVKQKCPVTGSEEMGWQLGDPINPLRPPIQKCCKERPSMAVI